MREITRMNYTQATNKREDVYNPIIQDGNGIQASNAKSSLKKHQGRRLFLPILGFAANVERDILVLDHMAEPQKSDYLRASETSKEYSPDLSLHGYPK